MSGGSFMKATIDFSEVEDGFAAMAKGANALRPAWIALRRPMRIDQADHAKKQAGSDGKWPARARSTDKRASGTRAARRKAVKRGKFTNKKLAKFRSRKLLGSLPNRTVSVKALADGVIAYSKVPWSGAHQEGARVGRGARLPKREFLWISDVLLRKAEDAIAEHIAGAF